MVRPAKSSSQVPGWLRRIGPHPFWIGLFGLWTVFLSGVLTPVFRDPGVIQLMRLRQLADEKRDQISRYETELLQLQEDAALLEKNRLVQQREIRKVLGYAAPGDLIFDFTPENDSPTPAQAPARPE